MDLDRNGMTVLDHEQSLALLRSVPVARVGLALNGIPVVLPVNFAIDHDEIVIRCTEGSKLDAALASEVVAVEVDDYDQDNQIGWSVIVKGRARELTEPDEVDHANTLELHTWANDATNHYIAISIDLVTGRSIGLPPPKD
jgi:nitroimidazol reductase NimA-like FMN-containing flavoprotein (pyridoxamine 5'-phosphate oxidase superfamily)